jgi:hypothetical protein
VYESNNSITLNKQTTKLTTTKETTKEIKLKCMRELEPKLIKQMTNNHATNGEVY